MAENTRTWQFKSVNSRGEAKELELKGWIRVDQSKKRLPPDHWGTRAVITTIRLKKRIKRPTLTVKAIAKKKALKRAAKATRRQVG